MDPCKWRFLIIQSLDRLGDEDYQRTTWFGGKEEIDSPDEMICNLVDDFQLNEYFEKYRNSLTPEIWQEYEELIIAISCLDKSDPYQVINDKKWIRIREIASKLANLMRDEA